MLAAQFESLRDPLVIMISVPMAICGALLPLFFGVATMNIYTQVGLVTLIGLISKHGILMVEFANELQLNENLDRALGDRDGRRASGLRPILMTTAAMVVGLIPLVLATGAARRAGSRSALSSLPAYHRHAVHAVRAAGGLHLHWRRSPARDDRRAGRRDRFGELMGKRILMRADALSCQS